MTRVTDWPLVAIRPISPVAIRQPANGRKSVIAFTLPPRLMTRIADWFTVPVQRPTYHNESVGSPREF